MNNFVHHCGESPCLLHVADELTEDVQFRDMVGDGFETLRVGAAYDDYWGCFTFWAWTRDAAGDERVITNYKGGRRWHVQLPNVGSAEDPPIWLEADPAAIAMRDQFAVIWRAITEREKAKAGSSQDSYELLAPVPPTLHLQP